MSFLKFEDDRVKVTEQGMTLPPVRDLWSVDKTGGHKFFNSAITYIYHMYHKGNAFENLPLDIARKRVCGIYCNGVNPDKFEKNKRVKAIIELYIELSYSIVERSYYFNIKKDIEDLHKRLDAIPFEKEAKVETTVMIPVSKDSDEMVAHKVDAKIMIDNSKEKMNVLNMVVKLYDLESLLKGKVEQEKKRKKKKSGRALFDRVIKENEI